MQVHYLEIVTADVDSVCDSYRRLYGIEFSQPNLGLGNARVASMESGGTIGVRKPMHETEEPVVRPYVLVEDVNETASSAVEGGFQIAHPPMELPGHGIFAILEAGGIHHGIWRKVS